MDENIVLDTMTEMFQSGEDEHSETLGGNGDGHHEEDDDFGTGEDDGCYRVELPFGPRPEPGSEANIYEVADYRQRVIQVLQKLRQEVAVQLSMHGKPKRTS